MPMRRRKNNDKHLDDKNETASYVRRSIRTLERWIAQGYFPRGHYIKGRPRWKTIEVDKWMTDHPAIFSASA